jgi:pimeloyl-ACP methyl ester carboxylesterase
MKTVSLPIWQELLVGVEMVYLRLSPVYWGYGIPKGDGSAVVVIPGFMGTDLYLTEFRAWLGRIGYKPYSSGIGLNAECPNLLFRLHLARTIEKAYKETGRKVHLIGHSLGGMMARFAAMQMPDQVASVISLASPFNGMAVHPSVQRLSEYVRKTILKRNPQIVLPDCYTDECACAFVSSLPADVPKSVGQTAIYTKTDGLVDWHCCMTGDPNYDFEVSATHIGVAFNPIVYQLIANRLAGAPVAGHGVRH